MFFQNFSAANRKQLSAAVIAILVTLWQSTAFAVQPTLPLVTLDTTYTPPSGRTISVAAGGDLQAAINSAQPGDIISLQAGATFTGNFTLPNKGGTSWIVIRTSAPDSSLPPPGTRISPAQASLLPKIVTPNTSPAITTDMAANHYRFIGVEITTTHADTLSTTYNLVWLEYTGGQTSLSQVPTDIIFDRCYLHGTPTGNVRRGILMNSTRSAVVDSYLSDFHEVGADSQAIMIYNGPGPFKIQNNYLEGAGENTLFGGADPTISNLVPSDIEIRGNYFYKPLSWRVGDPSYAGIHWTVKNLFELKNAQRLLIENNIFEHNWLDAQNGFGILFTVRDQNGTAPWSVVQDVTFRFNIVRHSGSAVNTLGQDDLATSQQVKRVLIQDNLFEDIGSAWGGNGILFQVYNNGVDVTIDHNTGIHDGDVIFSTAAPTRGFVYTNNISPHNLYGVIGNGTGIGFSTLNTYYPGYIFDKSVLAGGNPTNYPADNFFPASLNNVGFVDLAGGNYALSATSPYKNAATDGTDIGVDYAALLLVTAGTINGTTTGGTTDPPPADTTAPTISAVGAAVISSSGATITWTTNEAGDSQVEYGTTTAYGTSTTLDASMVTSHSQSLSGLAANTLYHYRVKSKDAAGNLATSADFTFTTLAAADTTPPTISGVAASPITTSGSTINWTTNESSDTQVEYGTTTAYGSSTSLSTSMVTSHFQSLSGMAAGTLYHYRVKSKDAAGNLATSADFTFTTLSALDATPPTVSVTAPLSGSTVKNTIKVSASASDNVSVAGVQFKLDGVNIGAEVTAAPYTISWNTSTTANGSHKITAVARDAAGNTATSAAVTVNVKNSRTTKDTTPPTISITSPANGATVSGTIAVSANASDNVGVASVQFKLDGANLAAAITSPPYSTSWNTTTATNGAHTLTAVAKDAAGNSTTSSSVAVTVNNAAAPSRSPFLGAAFSVPGTFQAEDFDNGGEGVAYHDLTAGNQGGAYRTNVDVDIVAESSGYSVNSFQTGEWLSYSINVAQAGTYRIEANVSSEFNNSAWHIEIDGVNVTGSILAPNTGNWHTFQFVGQEGINLTGGSHVLKIVSEQEYFNLDAIRILSDSGPTVQNVAWTNLVNVTATGNSIQKTSGCDGCPDAGATSQQQILSGNGYVEFSASETNTLRYLGLSNGNTDTSREDIDFSIGLWSGGGASVWENGVWKVDAPGSYAPGDVFRIAVESGVVKYYKNGVLFYSSAASPTYPLLVDTSLFSLSATLTNAVIFGAQ